MRRRSLLHLACVAFCTLPSQLAAQQLGPNQGGPVLNGQGQAPVIQVPAGQPQVGQPQIGQPQVGPLAPETPQPQILPCPFEPIDAEHEAYLRQLLEYWESSTDQIQRFHCSFTQWEFTVFGPAPDPTTGEHKATTMARGEIKYELPDKGYVDFSAKWNFVAATAEEPDHYVVAPDVELNRFITDGTHTYEFNFAEQIVNKVELPPEMRGRTIADGPIPFIFAAEADKMQARYWIRVVTPPEAATAGEYWLEAFPKFLGDRAEFHHVRVILDGEEFLPIALEVYDADHTDQAPHFSTYKFEDRRKNPNNSLFIIQRRPFYEPSIPSGWQMVERPLISPELPQGQPRVGEGLGPVER